MKYNLGCGRFKRKGFINVDIEPSVHPDVVADITVIPWKFVRKNQADLVFSDNLFEHIYPKPLLKVIQECHRVLKPEGLLQIIVPISAPENFMAMYSDPMHVNRNFTIETFGWYDYECVRWKNYGSVYGIPKFKLLRNIRNGRFLEVELKVIKGVKHRNAS